MLQFIKKSVKAFYRARGYYTVKIKEFSFKTNPKHLGTWRNASKGKWEPETYIILSKYLTPEMVYFDIGAWIGSTVLYASKKCKQVICFEPDPIAYQYLLSNIQLNNLKNVAPYNIALSDQTGIQKMGSLGKELGDSMTSLLSSSTTENDSFNAFTLQWDSFLKFSSLKEINFIKIDIEGAEFFLLPTLETFLIQHKPIVYLSTHAPFLDTSNRKKEMEKIVSIMRIYKNCYNSNLELIDINTISDDQNLIRCTSFLFIE